ncbi:MAG TPA: adenylate/guanylate cyclase domain-containing protein, partial [Mycobacterium sp.]|uniref:ATP-binding protein n=1 Tax=Mycobacterium sp. TaxID=1785 RepID=UPI002F4235F0
MTAVVLCRACGTHVREGARFCDACGSPMARAGEAAEYKQVTVLFADVVDAMGVAAVVGAERLREVMAELVNRAAAVVQRYGGTIDKFTGDGITAVFGAPVALEDHAFRACLAALGMQQDAKRLAAELEPRDGIGLVMRVGLNSGQVIAGEIGSGAFGYTGVGDPVGVAQRMEAVAPPGGVMLSEFTVRLVEDAAVLGESVLVRVEGVGQPVCGRRLVGLARQHARVGRRESTLVGRQWEMAALVGMLDRSMGGYGCVAGVVGPAGIGKSRMVAEIVAIAASRGAEVFSTFCESHASEIAFHAVAPLLRAVFGIEGLAEEAARVRVRDQILGADGADLVLFDDMLGIRDPGVALPDIAPDARRRRLTALVNAALLAHPAPRVFVIEDAHWIDQISEALLTDFLSVVVQSRSLLVITYRPEYRGALSRIAGAQTIALAPLDDGQTGALITELLGADPTVTGWTVRIAERAAGNPFFAEEIVRDLADRGVLRGVRGAYVCPGGAARVEVPATLQAAIAARIDRLEASAKRTLNAAAVIGLRFGAELLASLIDVSAVATLVDAELIDQVLFSPRAEYAFRHPLIHAVAYQSQLGSERAELHRSLAAAIQQRDPGSVEDNAALIAEHLEAAGDLHEAFAWHMRAGTWSTNRDIGAARMSWQRARQVADRLPADDPARASLRIAPRTLLCGSSWRAMGNIDETGFEELRQLASAADDKVSLVIGMSGQVTMLLIHGRYRDASQLASEYTGLIESIGDPTLTIALSYAAMAAKRFTGEATEVLRLAQLCIDLAADDERKGNLIFASPLAAAIAVRGTARCCFGLPGWKDDIVRAQDMVRTVDPQIRATVMMYGYGWGIANGVLLGDDAFLQETAEMLQIAEQSGEDLTLTMARMARGVALVHRAGPGRDEGFELLALVRDAVLREQFNGTMVPIVDVQYAKEKIRAGDVADAIELSRAVVEQEYDCWEIEFVGAAVTILVESLLARGTEADLQEAQAAIDRLAAVPTEPGFMVYQVALLGLRALLARARGEAAGY